MFRFSVQKTMSDPLPETWEGTLGIPWGALLTLLVLGFLFGFLAGALVFSG
jgi:hypothetical protein